MKYSQILLVLIIILASLYSYRQSHEIEQADKQELLTLLDVYEERMQTIINGTIKVSSILEELIILHGGNPPLEEIERLTKLLFDEKIHINISYAPNGVIEFSYPQQENEAAIGHRLLEDPVTKRDAQKALELKQATLSKPYQLRQGYVSAVVRDPVFIQKSGQEEFWGFVAIAMRTSDGIIAHSDIDSLEKFGYEYFLSYAYDGEHIDVLHSKNFNENAVACSSEFSTKYGMWELSLYKNPSVNQIIERTVSLLLIIASSIYLILSIVTVLLSRKKAKNY